MELRFPLSKAARYSPQLFPLAAEPLDPLGKLRAKLLFQLFSQPLRQCRAFSACGYGNLQRAAPHHGGIVEIAEIGYIHNVAQDSTALRQPRNFLVQLTGRDPTTGAGALER